MRNVYVILLSALLTSCSTCETIVFDLSDERQRIHSFGASDCWRTDTDVFGLQEEKREEIADLLFTNKESEDGSRSGIGLSIWRFNIGSGSREQGSASGIASKKRRTDCFLSPDGRWDWSKQPGQRWMLDAARRRGVCYTLGFSIAAPYFMSKNGLATATEYTPNINLRKDAYGDYASFLVSVSEKLGLDYLSPVNEPQWEWVTNRQEGTQALNEECAELIALIDRGLKESGGKTRIVFGEAADIRYLFRAGTDKPGRDNQIREMFADSGKFRISHHDMVRKCVTGHSYWSTYPVDTLIRTRKELRDSLDSILGDGYEYWQTEYCPMEKNPDNPRGGGGRDLGMAAALYIARVIHYDLTVTEASSWQSWTAFSDADYKDGLIYIDGGDYLVTKLLWAMGNYSAFVLPGMLRIGCVSGGDDPYGIMASAYIDKETGQRVVVIVNYSEEDEEVRVQFRHGGKRKNRMYVTSSDCDLQRMEGVYGGRIMVPSSSVITLVSE